MSDPQEILILEKLLYTGALGLLVLGVYTMTARRNLLRILLGLTLVEAGVNLFMVSVGFRPDAVAPILVAGQPAASMVDPIPQALILTAIVIGVGVLSLALALAARVHETHGTLDMRIIAERLQPTRHPAEPGTAAVRKQAPGQGEQRP